MSSHTSMKKITFINAALFGIILTATFLWSFWPAIEKLLFRLNTGDNNYGFLIIPLVAYLCWDRRFNGQIGLRFSHFQWSFWCLLLIIPAMGFILLGELGSVETIMYGGLWLAIVGITFLLYGWRTRHLAFPLLILAFMVPLPPFINRMLTFKLKMAATTIAVKMLRAVEISVLQTGNIIDLGMDKLQVVDACSGLRYFVPMILLALLVGYFFNRGLWRRLLLVAIVPPLSVVVNAFRIFVSGWLTVNGHRELAQNFFHDFSGWVVFMIAGVILLGISTVLRKIGRPAILPPIKDKRTIAPVGRIKPLALTTIVCLLFALSGFAIQKAPSSANLPDRAKLEGFPMQIAQWQGRQQYLSKEIMEQLWADDYVSALYHNPGSGSRIQLLIPFYEYQGTRHTAHAPQSCLLGGGFDLLKSEDRFLPTRNEGSIKVRTLLLKQGDTRILGAYFFLQRGRVITSPWENKFYLMWDALTRRRTDGALVRAELQMASGQSEEEAFAMLSEFLREIWVLLPEYVPV